MDEPKKATDRTEDVRRILAYHRRTKHQLDRYAAGPGQLDWANQPDPFRAYAGAPVTELPLLADAVRARYDELFQPGAVPPRRLDPNTLAILFELSLGLSAWKEYRGSRWALRCNPSSGNLHPTEAYAVVPALPSLEAGVYHYVSRDHRLERRCTLEGDRQLALPRGCLLIGLTSIHWREAWKYGERAFRYCQHDAGHALAAVRFAAGSLGWSARLLDEPGDADVAGLLGIDRDADFASLATLDREHPDALVLVGPPPLPALPMPGPDLVVDGAWAGQANRLSADHVRWEVIDIAAAATAKPRTEPVAFAPEPSPAAPPAPSVPAAGLIRQRRSCLGLDGRSAMTAATLYALLDRTLPRAGVAPWDLLPGPPRLHLGLFLHRVHGLAPGLYLFERSPTIHDELRAALRGDFLWRRPDGCPEHLALYLLTEGDFRDTARTVSCHQDIAADGAFSLGMIADFGPTIRAGGPWWYRRLFWESGVLGQLLYLEAEAAGLRGTGIGCYFDDAFHDLLGLAGDRFQDLYHFTVGGPVDDPRLRTMAAYGHLRR
jgi:SagB-type dehydrogenase family enzyme